jgi:hypothetical protein
MRGTRRAKPLAHAARMPRASTAFTPSIRPMAGIRVRAVHRVGLLFDGGQPLRQATCAILLPGPLFIVPASLHQRGHLLVIVLTNDTTASQTLRLGDIALRLEQIDNPPRSLPAWRNPQYAAYAASSSFLVDAHATLRVPKRLHRRYRTWAEFRHLPPITQ